MNYCLSLALQCMPDKWSPDKGRRTEATRRHERRHLARASATNAFPLASHSRYQTDAANDTSRRTTLGSYQIRAPNRVHLFMSETQGMANSDGVSCWLIRFGLARRHVCIKLQSCYYYYYYYY